MRARALIDGAAFGPDALKVIAQAFDEAWQEIPNRRRPECSDYRSARDVRTNRDARSPHASSFIEESCLASGEFPPA
jgi:hypothetical protein